MPSVRQGATGEKGRCLRTEPQFGSRRRRDRARSCEEVRRKPENLKEERMANALKCPREIKDNAIGFVEGVIGRLKRPILLEQ